MSKRISKKEVFAIISQADIKPSDELVAEIRNKYENDPDIFTDVPACRKEDGFMKKRILISAGVLCALVAFAVCLKVYFGTNKAYADYYSMDPYNTEINQSADVSSEFARNQHEVGVMLGRFLDKLPYQGKYKAAKATGDYTVDLKSADEYPDYYAGNYINVDGKLIVLIKDSYFDKNFRNCDWYKELAKMLGSEDFGCRPVKYNFTELINGMSDMVFGSLGKAIKDAGVEIVGVGLNDYVNGIIIDVRNEEDAAVVKSLANSDMYSIDVVGDVTVQFN